MGKITGQEYIRRKQLMIGILDGQYPKMSQIESCKGLYFAKMSSLNFFIDVKHLYARVT